MANKTCELHISFAWLSFGSWRIMTYPIKKELVLKAQVSGRYTSHKDLHWHEGSIQPDYQTIQQEN